MKANEVVHETGNDGETKLWVEVNEGVDEAGNGDKKMVNGE